MSCLPRPPRGHLAALTTWPRIALRRSDSQSTTTSLSFFFSRSWKSIRYPSSVVVKMLTAVTCQFFSAAVSRTFCRTDRPGGRVSRTERWQSGSTASPHFRQPRSSTKLSSSLLFASLSSPRSGSASVLCFCLQNIARNRVSD